MAPSIRRCRAVDESGDLRDDLGDGARGGDIVQRDGDVEAIFELSDDFENLQGVEAEIGGEIARRASARSAGG